MIYDPYEFQTTKLYSFDYGGEAQLIAVYWVSDMYEKSVGLFSREMEELIVKFVCLTGSCILGEC